MTLTFIDMAADESEVQALMFHHLRTAAALFEVLPGSLKVHRSVLLMKEGLEISPWIEAGIVWFDKLDEIYKDDDNG